MSPSLSLDRPRCDGAPRYLEEFLGPEISREEAETYLSSYLADNELAEKIQVRWTSRLNGAGRFQEKGSKSDPSKVLALRRHASN